MPSAGQIVTTGPDTIMALPPDDLRPPRGAPQCRPRGWTLSLAVEFTDLSQACTPTVGNSVLNHSRKPFPAAAKPTLTGPTFDRMQAGAVSAGQPIAFGDLKIEGRRAAVMEFVALFDTSPTWFNVVTA